MASMQDALMTHTGRKPQGLQFAQDTMQSIKDAPGNILKWAQQNPVDASFVGASTLPVVGDAIGFGKDVYDMSPMGDTPFTATNTALAGAGLLPFVPAGLGTIKKSARNMVDALNNTQAAYDAASNYGRMTRKQRYAFYGDDQAARSADRAKWELVDGKRKERHNLRNSGYDPLEIYGGGNSRITNKLSTNREEAAQQVAKAAKDAEIKNLKKIYSSKLWNKRFSDDVSRDISRSEYGYGYGTAINRANMEAVPRQLKKEGWTMRHASKGRSGKSSSRYIVSPDGKYEVRLSDHHLPETPTREYNQAKFGTQWNDEIVLNGVESPQDIIDEIKTAYKDNF